MFLRVLNLKIVLTSKSKQNNFKFATFKNLKQANNWSPCFGLFEEDMNLSCIHLIVQHGCG